MATILTADPISNSETERKWQELIYAFYKYWFSNTPRALSGGTVTFPLLGPENYLFNQQQSVPPPNTASGQTGPIIHTILTDLRRLTQGQSAATKLVKANAILTIYVRVRNPSDGMQTADFEARFWGDALRQIFESGTQGLAQLGLHHAKVVRGPTPVPAPAMQTRMLVVTGQLQYSAGY